MQDLSIDIKTMPQAFGGYHLLLVITCYQTNFTIAVPLGDWQTQTIAEALIYRVIYLFRPPRWIVCDENHHSLELDVLRLSCDNNGLLTRKLSDYVSLKSKNVFIRK